MGRSTWSECSIPSAERSCGAHWSHWRNRWARTTIALGRRGLAMRSPRRRALIARDRHCRWPGCERPASSCDGHHVIHWMHGGEGGIDNQVLLCHRHHWKVHEGGWQLIKLDDGEIVPVAPTLTFGIAR